MPGLSLCARNINGYWPIGTQRAHFAQEQWVWGPGRTRMAGGRPMKILVIDIGGSHVKLLATGQKEPRRFESGKGLTPDEFVRKVRECAVGWDCDAVSLGYPGLVSKDGPKEEPANLGRGWVGFDFAAAFGKPVKIINDAVMQ